jgi:Kdo2-lipid IVA lauroyltransferase/acyltransferase
MLITLRVAIVWRLILVCGWLLKRLPRPIFLFSGSALGAFLRLIQFRTNIARRNLERAYGSELDHAGLQRIFVEHYRHLGRLALEFVRDASITKEEIHSEITLVEFDEMRALGEQGRGFILITGHMGNWEIGLKSLAVNGFEVQVVAKRMSGAVSQKISEYQRRVGGIEVLHTGANQGSLLLRIHRGLRRGKVVVFAIDQHTSGPEGLAVPFFGHSASTVRVIARLARSTGAPVFATMCSRQPDGRHILRGTAEIPFRTTEIADDELRESNDQLINTEMYTKVIEDMVRRKPEQWMWIHRRWKNAEQEESQRVSKPH